MEFKLYLIFFQKKLVDALQLRKKTPNKENTSFEYHIHL